MDFGTRDSRETPRPQARLTFALVFVLAVVLLNLLALVGACGDRTWRTVEVVQSYGPIGNLLLCGIGLIPIPAIRRDPEFSMANHLGLAIGLPLAAIVVDFVLIVLFELHGC